MDEVGTVVSEHGAFYLVLFELKNYNKVNIRLGMACIRLKEVDGKWDVTPRWVNYYCTAGRIPGAVKIAKIWVIPKDAEKPVDRRCKKK